MSKTIKVNGKTYKEISKSEKVNPLKRLMDFMTKEGKFENRKGRAFKLISEGKSSYTRKTDGKKVEVKALKFDNGRTYFVSDHTFWKANF